MADISEMLSKNNPAAYKKLLDLSNKLRMESPYNDLSDATASGESSTLPSYENLFSKQIAQDAVDAQSIPGKSAAESAEVFSKSLPEGISEGNNLVPYAEEAMGKTVAKAGLGDLLPIAGKALGAAGIASNLYGDLADTSSSKPIPIPNHPGYFFKGQDIVKLGTPSSEPSRSLSSSSKGNAISSDDRDDDSEDDDTSSSAPDSKTEQSDDDSEKSDSSSSSSDKDDNEELARYKDLVAKASGNTPVSQKMNTSAAIASLLGLQDKQLQSAQDTRNSSQLMALLGRAGATAGAALSPLANIKPDNDFYNQLLKLSDQPVSSIKEQQKNLEDTISTKAALDKVEKEQRLDDPTSPESVAFRQALQQFPDLVKAYGDKFNDIAASDRQLVFDPLKLKEQMETRREASKNNAAYRQSMLQAKQDKEDTKLSQLDEKTQGEISKRLNGMSQSSRSAIGKASQAQISVNRLLDIVNDPKSTGQDLQSAAADLNQVVSGTTTMSGTEHQEYKTIGGDLSNAITYITSTPNAPNVPEIKQHIADVAKRMNKISDDVINKNVGMVGAGYTGWAKRHPDEMRNMISAASGGNDANKPSQQTALSDQDQATLEWAKNNPTDPDAQKFLKLHNK